MDVSGSMDLGIRLTIAKHVVNNIMETLSDDDFVTVLTFANDTKPLVDEFVDSSGEPELVQASKENIAQFMMKVKETKVQGTANMTTALTAAFLLLEKHRGTKVNIRNCSAAYFQLRWLQS